MLIRTASFPGSRPGQDMRPAAPRPAPPKPRLYVRRPIADTSPDRVADQAALAREACAFIAEHRLSPTEFCAQIGQSTNSASGFFVKAEAGRLRPTTVAKVRAFMAEFPG